MSKKAKVINPINKSIGTEINIYICIRGGSLYTRVNRSDIRSTVTQKFKMQGKIRSYGSKTYRCSNGGIRICLKKLK